MAQAMAHGDGDQHEMHGHDHQGDDGGMQMTELPPATAAMWIVLSYAALLITNIYAPIRF